MAVNKKLIELFRAIATNDVGHASTIAREICITEDQNGHRSVARQLRGALNTNSNGHSSHLATPAADLASINIVSSALVRLADTISLTDVVLTTKARLQLEEILQEWVNRDKLHKHNLSPRSKLLFHGTPGCGKSLTARAIAHELKIPIYLVRFDAVIGAYLGQTAIHLRQIFHFAETTPCVLLLDEIDALGKRRGNPLDVGELDRIVIALMQELEHSNPLGIIVATSNLPKHLDAALWRRFDINLAFNKPSKSALIGFAKTIASKKQISLPPKILSEAAKSKSFADAESIVLVEARRQALKND